MISSTKRYGPVPTGPERDALVALLRDVLRGNDSEIDQAVHERGVRLARDQVDRVVVYDVDPSDLGHGCPVGRLLLRIEDALEGEADRLGVERLAVVEDHALTELELEGDVVHEAPGFGELRHDAVLGVAADEGVENAHADHGPEGGEVHGRVEVFGGPRDGYAELALGLGYGGRRQERQEGDKQNDSVPPGPDRALDSTDPPHPDPRPRRGRGERWMHQPLTPLTAASRFSSGVAKGRTQPGATITPVPPL